MRTFNLRLFLLLTGICLVSAVAVLYAHRHQVRRNASVYRDMAASADKAAREVLEEYAAGPRDRVHRDELLNVLESAVRHYRRYLSLSPGDGDTREQFGRLLMQAGDPAGAFGQFEQVLRGDTPREELRKLQVMLAMRLQRYTDAIDHLRNYLILENPSEEQRADQARLNAQLSHCLLRLGQPQDAEQALEKAVELDPSFVWRLLRTGCVAAGPVEPIRAGERDRPRDGGTERGGRAGLHVAGRLHHG